jgi:hypothetical protein
MNIYQRVNEVRKKVWYAKKDKAVQGYKAVTHDAVTALVRNHLIDQGVIVVPRWISSDTVEVGTTKGGTAMIRYAARYEVDFVNCDDPADKIIVPMEAHANDHGDKAPGKATSYATKYAILKLFSIETGEDEEGRAEAYGRTQPVTEEQALEIRKLIEDTGSDEAKLLAYAKAESIEEIREADFKVIVKRLKAKLPKEAA